MKYRIVSSRDGHFAEYLEKGEWTPITNASFWALEELRGKSYVPINTLYGSCEECEQLIQRFHKFHNFEVVKEMEL